MHMLPPKTLGSNRTPQRRGKFLTPHPVGTHFSSPQRLMEFARRARLEGLGTIWQKQRVPLLGVEVEEGPGKWGRWMNPKSQKTSSSAVCRAWRRWKTTWKMTWKGWMGANIQQVPNTTLRNSELLWESMMTCPTLTSLDIGTKGSGPIHPRTVPLASVEDEDARSKGSRVHHAGAAMAFFPGSLTNLIRSNWRPCLCKGPFFFPFDLPMKESRGLLWRVPSTLLLAASLQWCFCWRKSCRSAIWRHSIGSTGLEFFDMFEYGNLFSRYWFDESTAWINSFTELDPKLDPLD